MITNIHSRKVGASKAKIISLLKTLATKNDLIWPKENWPKMYLDNGLKTGSIGGHGPIKYVIQECADDYIKFKFLKPKEFIGFHSFKVEEIDALNCSIKHTIEIEANILGAIKWHLGIRWLHDALIEDALDKLENYFDNGSRKSNWNIWVKCLRMLLK